MTTNGVTRTSSSGWSLAACSRRFVRLLAAPIALLFPPACVRCGRSVALGQVLCPTCAPQPESGEGARCVVCGQTLSDDSLDLCLPCGVRSQAFDRVLALGDYDGDWGSLVRTLKFDRETAIGRWLAEQMVDRCREDPGSFDCVAYVPMTARERRDRGFNPSRLLARLVARRLGLPLKRDLKKIRRTRRQSSLPAGERRENLRGAFRAIRSVHGRALLVDDIFTTGATANVCAETLKGAGCDAVTVLVVARA